MLVDHSWLYRCLARLSEVSLSLFLFLQIPLLLSHLDLTPGLLSLLLPEHVQLVSLLSVEGAQDQEEVEFDREVDQ